MLIPGYDSPTLIGRGGFAHVYRAHQRAFDRDVAVKVLLLSLDDDRDRRRFERECSAMGRLTGHPHIVTVLESGVTPEGHPYLTTPYYESGTLADRLAVNGPADVDDVLGTGVALAGALDLAHANGILHRDVKPANVLLSAYGEPALADFGIAVIAAEVGDRSQVTHAFTITHAAPEILDGQPATSATDVYSLASTLWTMLTGTPPFGHDDGQGLAARVHRIQHEDLPPLGRSDAPVSLENALRYALGRTPEHRPTAVELGRWLQAVQRERGAEVTPMRSGAVDLPALGTTRIGAVGAVAPASPSGTVAWGSDQIRWADDAAATRTPPEAEAAPLPQPVVVEAPAPAPPGIQIDAPPAPPPAPAPSAAPPPARSTRALLLTAAGAVVVIGLLVGGWLAVSRDDPDASTATPTTTVTEPTTVAPSVVDPPTTPSPPSTAATTTAPADDEVLGLDGVPERVRTAAVTAQGATAALAAGDWDSARRLIPSLSSSSDAALADAWGGLDRATLVLTDWNEQGPSTDLRLGQVAVEQVDGATRTSLYCVTWTVRDGTVSEMADQQVVAAPWQSGAADPTTATATLDDACRPLDGPGKGGGKKGPGDD